MSSVLVQSGVRHASYSESGMLLSWWRREKGKQPNYVESLGVFTLSRFEYEVAFCDTDANPDTDGWPQRRSSTETPIEKPKRARPRAEELI